MKKRRLKQIAENRYLYLMFLPVMAYFIIWHYIPIWGTLIAFQDVKYLGTNEWVGLKHFKTLFSSPAFRQVLKNTVIISSMKIFLIFPLPIVLALLLNEVKAQGFKKVIQSVIYLPHFLSWVVIAGLFIYLLSPSEGIVNLIREKSGKEVIPFMTSIKHIRWVFVYSEIWRSIGWDSILYTAAIITISPSLYDAATVDGASSLQQLLFITLPAIVPTIITVFILNLGFFMNAGFDQVFNMMNDTVISVTDIIDTYVYRIGIKRGNYSLGTAAGLFKGAIGLLLILSTHFLSKKTTDQGLWQ